MNVLVIDIGGNNVKILASGQNELRKFSSGPSLTPKQMVAGVKQLAAGWKYDVISMGYPGMVVRNRLLAEPHNLGRGWMEFDFAAAFKRPVKIVNDAAMQALGSYKGGKMLFLGLGTGLGSAMIVDGILEPMELAHLSYKKGTYEDYVGARSLAKRGKKKWRSQVAEVVNCLIAALEPDDVVLGGGNVKETESVAEGLSRGQQRQCLPGRISPLGKGGPAQNFHSSKDSLRRTTKK